MSALATTAEARLHVGEVTFYRDSSVLVIEESDDLTTPTGGDDGRIMVTLGIDGDITRVSMDSGQTGQLELIQAAIEELQAAYTELSRLYPHGTSGRCLVHGDWGRCASKAGHDGSHAFPTG